MIFKNIRLFKLSVPFHSGAEEFAKKLTQLAYKPCLPSMATSYGWTPPEIGREDAPLAKGMNGCIMFCLQVEEKLLPASVVSHHLKEKIREVEAKEARRVRQKEKQAYKEELIQTLLTRAFSKHSYVHAFIDTRTHSLLVGSVVPKRIELLIACLNKTFGECVEDIELSKPSSIFTQWVQNNDYPSHFNIEKSCVMQDPQMKHRVIRAQQQDLGAASIQSLIKDGCDVIQLALTWHDRLSLVLTEDFAIRTIRVLEEDIDLKDQMESKEEKFDADFLIMTHMYSELVTDLMDVFEKSDGSTKQKLALAS